jgi:O-antigen/teichoic acid export membrane protein
MLLTMLVALYTVRIVLKTLGIVDYGIYNVVGGIVTMFSFLSVTMASASQRFFAFELGRKDYTRLKQTFSLTFTIYIGIAFLILLLAETVGLWFLNTQMTIPSDRMGAANWVYQFSVLSFMMTVLTIPYNAAIIAREKMKVYAYVSIVDVVLKLLIVYLLVLFSFDKLKLYAVLTFVVTTIVTFIYRTYCKRKFEECTYSFYWDKKMMSALFSYSGWNMIGAATNIFRTQGINIMLNVFYGPVVNAARAVSFQIYGALTQFITNLYSSTRPQITKYYAQNETELMWRLVFDSTKISYYLFMILSIPFFLEVEYIFTLWLGNIPEYAPLISRLILIGFMLEATSNQLVAVLQAANKIKNFQVICVPILLLNLPVSFILLRLGGSPYMPFIVSIIITILYIIFQILIVKKDMGLQVIPYLKNNIKLVLVTFLSVIFPYFLHTIMNFGIIRFVTILVTSLLSSGIFIWFIGIDRSEKNTIVVFLQKQFSNWQYAKNRKI